MHLPLSYGSSSNCLRGVQSLQCQHLYMLYYFSYYLLIVSWLMGKLIQWVALINGAMHPWWLWLYYYFWCMRSVSHAIMIFSHVLINFINLMLLILLITLNNFINFWDKDLVELSWMLFMLKLLIRIYTAIPFYALLVFFHWKNLQRFTLNWHVWAKNCDDLHVQYLCSS